MLKVVFASSGGAVYSEQQVLPVPEDHTQYPVSPYGVSKLACERYLVYNVQFGLPYIALRYTNVYGPRQDPHGEVGVVAIFCGNLARGKTSTINGDEEQTRDYVYVKDVARANVLALENYVPSAGAYNLGTGVETSVNRLYERLLEISAKDLPPHHGPSKPGEQLRSCVDPGRTHLRLARANRHPHGPSLAGEPVAEYSSYVRRPGSPQKCLFR